MTSKRLTRLALYTAMALIIHILESLVPLPVPVPGVKPGLANTVTLFILFVQTERPEKGILKVSRPAADAFIVLLCRIILGAVFTGRLIVIIYSLTGGLLAFAAMVITRCFVTERQVWVCGAAGAIFHNIGQILAAIIITGTPAIVIYLPALIIAGVIAGSATGLIAGIAADRGKKAGNSYIRNIFID